MKKILSLFSLLLYLVTLKSYAVDSDPLLSDSAAVKILLSKLSRIDSSYKTGEVEIGNGIAIIQIPSGYKLLDATNSRFVLTELWENPPDTTTLGLLFPESTMLQYDSTLSFGIEISYAENGHLHNRSLTLDNDDLLEQMQENSESDNEKRKKLGYTSAEIVGWSSPPVFDSIQKNLQWATELRFEGNEENMLNYNVRIFGRKGSIRLNVIGDMSIMEKVKIDIGRIIQSIQFKDGFRYEEYNTATDKISPLTLNEIIAGRNTEPSTPFNLLTYIKILLVLVIVAIGLFWKKLFRKKIDQSVS